MSAPFFLILHLISMAGLVSSMTIILLFPYPQKWASMALGMLSISLFVSGIGMVHANGYSMGASWISAKMMIWLILAGLTPVVAKRFPTQKKRFFVASLLLVCLAIGLAVVKP